LVNKVIFFRTDSKQSLDGFCGNQISRRVKIKAQYPTAGVDKYLPPATIRIHAQDISAGHSRVKLPVLSDSDKFRSFFLALLTLSLQCLPSEWIQSGSEHRFEPYPSFLEF
jgi:hypothetical protein